jgi:hypothetical protein
MHKENQEKGIAAKIFLQDAAAFCADVSHPGAGAHCL